MAVQALSRARPRVAGPSLWQRIWEARLAYLYILPGFLIMAIVTFFPLIFQVWMSLTDYGITNLNAKEGLFAQIWGSFSPAYASAHPQANAPKWVGLENFLQILGNRLALPGYDFWYMLSFNLIWTFINVFFHVVLGVAFAMLLNSKGLLFKRFYRAFYIIPWALPALISGMIWHNMYDKDYGAINLLAGLKLDWLKETATPFQQIFRGLSWGIGLGEEGWPYLLLPAVSLLVLAAVFLLYRARSRKSASGALLGSLASVAAAAFLFLAFPFVRGLDSLASWLYYLIAFGVVGLIVVLFVLTNRYRPDAAGRAIVLIAAIVLGVGVLILIGWELPYSFYAVLLANIWLGWPFMMTVATGALQGIPEELYEAARIDGASDWQAFWQITVPLIRPAMVPAIMIGMMMTFNQFNVIYFVTGGEPLHRTEILVTQAFRLVNERKLYGVAASFSIIVFFVLAIITVITNRISRATESYAV